MANPILCPICANPVKQEAGELVCEHTGIKFHRGLTKLIRDIVSRANSVEPLLPRDNAPWFVCPNCGGDLEEYEERMRSLRCARCALKMPATVHDEMSELRERHKQEIERRQQEVAQWRDFNKQFPT